MELNEIMTANSLTVFEVGNTVEYLRGGCNFIIVKHLVPSVYR